MATLLQANLAKIAAIRAGFELRRASRPVFVCPDHLLGWVPMGGDK